MTLLRDLGRRRLRTTLTILGITIGIWALVVFGSMSNKINAIVDGGSDFYADKVTVAANGSGMGFGQPLEIETVAEVEAVDGVALAVPSIGMPLEDEMSSGMGMEYISGEVAGSDQGLESYQLNVAIGRELSPEDEGAYVTVLGSDLARQFDASVGSTVDDPRPRVRGRGHPGADPDHARQLGHDAPRGRPGAVRGHDPGDVRRRPGPRPGGQRPDRLPRAGRRP